jgi:hypothetical protein
MNLFKADRPQLEGALADTIAFSTSYGAALPVTGLS